MRMKRAVSVAGVIFSQDRSSVLLIQRRDVPVWVLPGGGVERNEYPEETVVREILEETGFTVKVERLVGHYTPINRLAKPTDLYECTICGGKAKLTNETRGIRFFALNALPWQIPPPYQEWIEDALQRHPPLNKALHSVNYWAMFSNLIKHPILVIRFLLARLGFPINSQEKEREDEGKQRK